MKNTIYIDKPARPMMLTTLFSRSADQSGLLSLTTDRHGEVGILTWQAAADQHAGHFVLEHSSDGMYWQPLGPRYTTEERTSIHMYRFAGGYPEAGLNYYRLLYIALNGQLSWSKVAILGFVPEYNVSWYTVDRQVVKLDIRHTGREKYRLIRTDGRVREGILQNGQENFPSLAPGEYMLEVFTASGIWRRRIDVPRCA
ncbi:hypothetical protein [Puia dinghuensis]|uniref:T9SS C-terminal target domain-containing protein n=1 Tax=Puia dinghuensis TaxID=1792502 RepID=A0A8J2UED8_9BACT|nr:hypothetical protein [Puia dinghuensis]GGB06127.1 hypothetical protein GCM10011511_31930 [Puia dinghuensis]